MGFFNRRLRKALPLSVVLVSAAPLTASEDGVVLSTADCQSGTCCPEPKSTCIIGSWIRPDKYLKVEGSCTEILPYVPG